MAIPTIMKAFFLVVAMMICHRLASSSHVSVSASLESQQFRHRNRHLLQALKECPVNFQIQNYTIITSQCEGPSYPKDSCCNALLEFACPFAAQINDNTTDCASRMFTYIRTYGKYPSGLFANLCVGDSSFGLECPANSTLAVPPSSNASSDLGSIYSGYYRLLLWAALASLALSLFEMSIFFDYR